jgi:signal transduction histidine kinase
MPEPTTFPDDGAPDPSGRGRAALSYAALWVPIGGLYVAVLMATGSGPLPVALSGALHNVLPAAILGAGVWWLSGRIGWPERDGVTRFLALQVALAASYSVGWAALLWTSWAVRFGEGRATLGIGRFVGWQLLSGVWLYGIVAGVSYAVRTARAARERRLLLERAERGRAQAELAALRAHLSPHFLFNTLHSLKGLVRDDAPRAEEAVQQLGDLLHYVLRLDRERSELVRLEDEWAFVRAYLALETLRLGDRLRIVVDVDPEALACLVPPFVLQPLVENAVRHAVAPRRLGGSVRIAAAVDEVGVLRLVVEDDGPGASPGTLAAAVGLGLRSVRERVRALGGDASVVVRSAPGAGFAVDVALPARSRRPSSSPSVAHGHPAPGVPVPVPGRAS